MESNACARLRWRPRVRPRNVVVIGLAVWAAEGCCAARLTGNASARIAAYEIFIRSLESWWGGFVILAGWIDLRNGAACTEIVRRSPRYVSANASTETAALSGRITP